MCVRACVCVCVCVCMRICVHLVSAEYMLFSDKVYVERRMKVN